MKKLVFALLLGTSFLLCGEEVKMENLDFSAGLKSWVNPKLLTLPAEKLGFKVEKIEGKNTLVIVGPAKDAKLGYKQITRNIPRKQNEILNHWVTLSAEIKVEKLSGSFKLMVREARRKGTIRYRQTWVSKMEETGKWQKYSCRFAVGKPTEFIQIYLQSCYLAPGDKLYLRGLKLDISPRKK